MQTNFFQPDTFFQSPFRIAEPPQVYPLSPLRTCFSQPQENLIQILELEQPQIPYGPGVIQVQPDPHEQPVKPQVIGKSPPFEPCCPSNRSQIPSTILSSENGQHSVPELSLEQDSLGFKVKQIIAFLVENSDMSADRLLCQGKKMIDGHFLLEEALSILVGKFKTAKKTREQMVKFCIRKALAFMEETQLKQKRRNISFDRELNSGAGNVFNRIAAQKNINRAYILKLFQNSDFQTQYRLFLQNFERLAFEDNQHKIGYLASQVEHALSFGEVCHLEKVKRLPWTDEMFKKARSIAVEMSEGRMPEAKRSRKDTPLP